MAAKAGKVFGTFHCARCGRRIPYIITERPEELLTADLRCFVCFRKEQKESKGAK